MKNSRIQQRVHDLVKELNVPTLQANREHVQAVAKMPGDILDLNRKFSFGPRGGAKSFVNEQNGGQKTTIRVRNEATADVVIAFGGVNHSQFGAAADLVTALGIKAVASDGIVFTDGGGDCTVTCLDSGRYVDHLMNYMGKTPTRITGMSLTSKTTAGASDESNYAQSFQTVYASPFQKTVDNYLDLRQFQDNKSTAVQFADVNFLKENFLVKASDEDFFLFTVKSLTELTMTLHLGAQYSTAQEFHRAVKAADEALTPLR